MNNPLKNLFSKLSNRFSKNNHFLGAWIIYHGVILVFFLFVWLINGSHVAVDADLFNMLPKPFQEHSVRSADERLTEITGQNVFILAAGKDFNQAKSAAESAYMELADSDNFTSISLYNDLTELSEITDFLYKYRWNLLDKKSIELIESDGGAESFAMQALEKAYSPFTMLSLDNLDSDPFMLAELALSNYLESVQDSGIAMSVKDGVLAREMDGIWYVMIRCILSKKGAALASKSNGVTEIYDVCSKYEDSDVRFIYSGTPINSHQSSTSAATEITVISTVSLLIVIILLLVVFKSSVPVVMSVVSILISILTAVLVTLGVFHKMHILTLVFGTSLIGSCIDYSLHFFTHWAGNNKLTSGSGIRKHLLPGLTIAIISSVLCFAILLFAPFNLLKQMALFSLSGLISSYLTTIALYPYIKLKKPEDRKIKLLSVFKESEDPVRKKRTGRIVVTSIVAVAVVVLLVFHKQAYIENDLNRLYELDGKILSDMEECNEVTQYFPTGWFIISGATEEETLQKEEMLVEKISSDPACDFGYISTTAFVPSVEHQKASREACRKLLALAEFQLEMLGFDSDAARVLAEDFEASEGEYLSFESGTVPEFLETSISTAWLGNIDGRYYSVIMPDEITDAAALKKFASSENGIYFINKISDMSSDLDKLTVMILRFFAVAYVILFIVIKFFYNWKQTLKIVSIPLFIVLMTVTVFAALNIPLEFFSITGLILVFGLGMDYIIYMMENEKAAHKETNTIEPFATMLSFITTVISFGALSLSSFAPVHLMGLSIFIGLTTAYICSVFYDRSF